MIRFLKICKHYIASVKGWEFRDSFKTGFSLGTNFWDGTGEINYAPPVYSEKNKNIE